MAKIRLAAQAQGLLTELRAEEDMTTPTEKGLYKANVISTQVMSMMHDHAMKGVNAYIQSGGKEGSLKAAIRFNEVVEAYNKFGPAVRDWNIYSNVLDLASSKKLAARAVNPANIGKSVIKQHGYAAAAQASNPLYALAVTLHEVFKTDKNPQGSPYDPLTYVEKALDFATDKIAKTAPAQMFEKAGAKVWEETMGRALELEIPGTGVAPLKEAVGLGKGLLNAPGDIKEAVDLHWLGGYLPGGSTPDEAKAFKESVQNKKTVLSEYMQEEYGAVSRGDKPLEDVSLYTTHPFKPKYTPSQEQYFDWIMKNPEEYRKELTAPTLAEREATRGKEIEESMPARFRPVEITEAKDLSDTQRYFDAMAAHRQPGEDFRDPFMQPEQIGGPALPATFLRPAAPAPDPRQGFIESTQASPPMPTRPQPSPAMFPEQASPEQASPEQLRQLDEILRRDETLAAGGSYQTPYGMPGAPLLPQEASRMEAPPPIDYDALQRQELFGGHGGNMDFLFDYAPVQ